MNAGDARGAEQTQSTMELIVNGIGLFFRILNAMAAAREEQTIDEDFEELQISRRAPKKLNNLLDDIHKQYIQLKDDDFNKYYKVFSQVFSQINARMEDVDPYYKKYSSRKQCAGSHYDNLRITMPSEFDVDIVINMPANYSVDVKTPKNTDINIESESPAYVKLKMGNQFQNIPSRDDVKINITAYKWMNPRTNYLQRSKFHYWFKSVVDRAFNQFEKNSRGQKIVRVNDDVYILGLKSSGPALTLVIKGDRDFLCEVDLVPALRMLENRWPVTSRHRKIPRDCSQNYWMVVPKLNKSADTSDDEWRIALHDQEWKMMKNVGGRMKQGIRFLKKLRDALKLDIPSYYIKTLFFHEIVEERKEFWSKSDAIIFKHMVNKFHEALVKGEILYFWHKGCNLLENYHRQRLNEYARKLEPLINLLEQPDNEEKCLNVAKYLLTKEEYQDYLSSFNCS